MSSMFISHVPGRKPPCARRVLLLLAVALLLSGCSDGRPTRITVSGQVFIDGQLGQDGRFTLTCYDGGDGVVPGRHRAQISAMEVIGPTQVKWYAPPKYADFRTSELEYEINEPTNDLKIELTWDGGKPFVQ
jgi:hypothetical protein